ncbi:hypothetical protein [Pseudomonas sp. NFIX28]|nr:hypothetical protein [Pseudomonas sp. NFIX28]SDZ03124.1 hypothetical protein SAMN03159453_02129 [Pseudomonas sp. NFIX28]
MSIGGQGCADLQLTAGHSPGSGRILDRLHAQLYIGVLVLVILGMLVE